MKAIKSSEQSFDESFCNCSFPSSLKRYVMLKKMEVKQYFHFPIGRK